MNKYTSEKKKRKKKRQKKRLELANVAKSSFDPPVWMSGLVGSVIIDIENRLK